MPVRCRQIRPFTGATYSGTLQMFVDPLGRTMKGKWLGFGKNFEINPRPHHAVAGTDTWTRWPVVVL